MIRISVQIAVQVCTLLEASVFMYFVFIFLMLYSLYIYIYRYDSDNEMFLLRVRDCVEKSKASVYDPPAISDSHALVFSPYQPAIHDRVLEEMKKETVSFWSVRNVQDTIHIITSYFNSVS